MAIIKTLFPDYKTDFIFDKLTGVSFITSNAEKLNVAYMAHSGEKDESPLTELNHTGETFTTEEITELVSIIQPGVLARFKHLTDMLNLDYNPIENYNSVETTKMGISQTSTQSGIPYDSTTFIDVSKNKLEYGDGENRLEKAGNIGVTTTQQMMEQEKTFWEKYNLYDILFDAIDDFLTLNIY